ncbi:MAG: hypothetical protein WAV00_01205 [Nocardioides sp.]
MLLSRALRVTATSAVLALAVGAVTTTTAEARPTKPGRVVLSASATEPAIGSYKLHITWGAVANATGYQVSISRSGSTLATSKFSASTLVWNKTVSATPGQTVTVSGFAVIGHFKGKSSSTSVHLLDTIAPTATYTVQEDTNTGQATLIESDLTDDSPLSGVTRTVDWGEGAPVVYAAGAPITHTYPLTEARYQPHVTLKDAAGNTTDVDPASGVVVSDSQAPTGGFAVSRTTAWAKYTKVGVSETTAVVDNWTPSDLVTRTVDWTDGTSSTWLGGSAPPKHVFAVGGPSPRS